MAPDREHQDGCACGHDHEHDHGHGHGHATAQNAEQDGGQAGAISAQLDEFACAAIGMALDQLAEGQGIWPTVVLLDDDGTSEYLVFEDDGLDVCLVQARGYVNKMSPASTCCYVVFYDGFFDEQGIVDNALVAEFGQRGQATAYSAVVPYGNAGDPDGFWYDEALPGGEEENLLNR